MSNTPDGMLASILNSFRLEGEAVIRLSNGRPVKEKAEGYTAVQVKVSGRWVVTRLHRIKFALHHGYLPPEVDHRNRVKSDNSLGNLRPATHAENLRNIPRRSGSGVYRRPSGRWQARVSSNGPMHLGTFDTREEAEEAADAARRQLYGEFYGG